MSLVLRYAVKLGKDTWIGSNTGRDWRTGKPSYRVVDRERARLFLRQADATKARNAVGEGLLVLVRLEFTDQ